MSSPDKMKSLLLAFFGILIIAAISLLGFSYMRDISRKVASKADPQLAVLAGICSALRALDKTNTQNAVLILESTLDTELFRMAGKLEPKALFQVYSNNPDFEAIRSFRSRFESRFAITRELREKLNRQLNIGATNLTVSP